VKIFYVYILRKFFRVFFIAAAGFLMIFVFSGIVSRIDIFSKYHSSLSQILFFISLKIPDWLLRVIPISVLLAEVITITELKRNNELVAISTGGVSVLKIVKPFLWTGVLMSIFIGFFEDRVALRSTKNAYRYYNEVIKGQKPKDQKGKFFNLILKGKDKSFYYLGIYDADKRAGSAFYFDDLKNGQLRQIVAESFRNESGFWILSDGVERHFGADFIVKKVEIFKRKKYDFPPVPSDFIVSQLTYQEMPLFALAGHIKKLKSANLPSVSERVEFHSRISQAFSPLIVVLIGIPFGFLLGPAGRILAVVLSVVVSFIYWGIFSLGISFAQTQVLSPVTGVWLANVLFAVVSVFYMRRKFV
jgi:lipopolysaccharide export system permease protein